MNTNNSDPVAIITTGGTISAAFGQGITTLDTNAGSAKFRQFVDAYCFKHKIKYQVFAPLNKFSGDFEPADWGILLEQIGQCIKSGYKRIVIAHGTDTLAYSVFAASLYFGARDVRVCFTCSFVPPSEAGSDAFQNIAGAIQAVCSDEILPGVYVSYQQSFVETDIFRAQDIKPMETDKTYFEGRYEQVAARVANGHVVEVNTIKSPSITVDVEPPTAIALSQNKTRVIILPCYPGLSLTHLALDPEKETLIILDNYHCGTVPSVSLRPDLERLKKTHPKTVVVSAAHPYRYVRNPYETTAALERDELLRVYRYLMPHQLYVIAVCESARKDLASALDVVAPWRLSAVTSV